MAEATQAATAVSQEPITTAPVAVETKQDVVAEVAAEDAGKTKKETPRDRAAAAIAKAEAAEKAEKSDKKIDAKPADAAKEAPKDEKKPESEAKKDETPDKAKAEADAKKAEEAAKENPKLSRAMAIVAERERAVAKRESALKTQIETERRTFEETKRAFETERARDSQDLEFVRKVRETIQKDGKYAAARLLGFTMDELVEAKSHEVEPNPAVTAEEVVRRLLREEREAREKEAAAAKEAEASSKKQQEEKQAAEEYAEASDFVHRTVDIHNADTSKRPWLAASKTNGQQIWELSKAMRENLGRKPTPDEVLDKAEELLRKQYEPLIQSRQMESATTQQPAEVAKVVPEPPKPAPKPAQKAQPAERKPGKYQKRETPMDRLAAVLRTRGIQ